ncbi:DUF4112 domain-containing protein [Pseudooceanicola marinus]|uniref:DUF4112 domain-containing protein n=1 Tax=Pseudooceanicola marinus TaxID=396013 RepID=UPI001CD1E12D|nr:DUF4112 domain-containing protein [Pseudooceanicola marinus]MCA1334483.1 DUF4112 domain-containing protein [Pseudooceanicola marinus]
MTATAAQIMEGPSRAEALARLRRLERLADRMDRAFRLPGTNIRFGWDSIVGLLPGIGDTATLAPAAWIIMEGHRLGLPRHSVAQMVGNAGIDWIVGSIPLVGDLFDVGWKGNLRNVALIRRHLEGV